MLPRLRNEEMLREISAVGAGSGNMSDASRRGLLRELETPQVQRVRQPATASDLEGMGIGVAGG